MLVPGPDCSLNGPASSSGATDIVEKVESIPLSVNSIKCRIGPLREDMLAQLIVVLKNAGKFSLQTDESVDTGGNSQLMVFISCRGEEDMHEEFLFCSRLSSTTTREDAFNMINNFFKKFNLDWLNWLTVTTDGAPSMKGSHLGFATGLKQKPTVFHRENLISKRLQTDLHAVLNDAIRIVDFVKTRALNSRIFHKCVKSWVYNIETCCTTITSLGCLEEGFLEEFLS